MTMQASQESLGVSAERDSHYIPIDATDRNISPMSLALHADASQPDLA